MEVASNILTRSDADQTGLALYKSGALYLGLSSNFMGINGSSLHNSLTMPYMQASVLCVIVSAWLVLGLLSCQSVFHSYYWMHSETGGHLLSPRARSVALSPQITRIRRLRLFLITWHRNHRSSCR